MRVGESHYLVTIRENINKLKIKKNTSNPTQNIERRSEICEAKAESKSEN